MTALKGIIYPVKYGDYILDNGDDDCVWLYASDGRFAPVSLPRNSIGVKEAIDSAIKTVLEEDFVKYYLDTNIGDLFYAKTEQL